jgi:hypothetical protein
MIHLALGWIVRQSRELHAPSSLFPWHPTRPRGWPIARFLGLEAAMASTDIHQCCLQAISGWHPRATDSATQYTLTQLFHSPSEF